MSEQPTTTYPSQPLYQPQVPMPVKKASKLKRFGLPVGLLALGLMVGGTAGASAVPEPVEVVKEVPVEKIVTKTKEVTPQACLTAISQGELIIQSSGRVATIFSDILSAVQTMDAAAIRAANPKLDAETATIKGITPKYQNARDECRAG
jgi:hypothetical protein